MANIVTVAVPAFIEESSEYDTQYKRTMKWNPEKGDFVRNASNQVVECTGEEGYMIWCMKVSMTERYSCLAYPNDIGVEMEDALAQDDEKTVESMVERTITEALLVNPRTEYVRGFEFTWNGDELFCSFIVKGIDWKEFSLSVTIGNRARR